MLHSNGMLAVGQSVPQACVQALFMEETAEFARLFLVPGVDHGFRGAGPGPVGLSDAMVRWVEEGKAPEVLGSELRDASGKLIRTRPVYAYPQVAKYKGSGSTDEAANFESRTPQP